MSGSLWLYELLPSRLLCPWDLQNRMMEWVAISFSKGSSWPRDQTRISHIAGRFFTIWATREVPILLGNSNKKPNKYLLSSWVMLPYTEYKFLKCMKIFKYCCLPFTMYRAVDFFLFINAKTLKTWELRKWANIKFFCRGNF